MAKDDRLYARFDIAMDEHPKIMLLSDVGFRALVEATLYSRRQLTDGFLAARIAERKWGREAIAELTSNDPERPSWHPHIKDGVDGYMIHDFAEHQTTNADIEAKRAAGRMGGLAKAAKTGSKPVAPATDVPKQKASTTSSAPLAITETETETKTSTSNEVERTARKRASRLDPQWVPSNESVQKAREDAPDVDHHKEHSVFVDYWIAQPGQKGVKTDWDSTWRNWMRRAQKDLKQRGGKQTPTDRARQTASLGRPPLATELIGLEQ
jgi:hypothetical protein